MLKIILKANTTLLIILAHSCARYAQAMNEYRGGEMSSEVVVDRNLWTELWTVDGSESVLQA